MNKPILKDMIKEEMRSNPLFQRGRKYAQVLVALYAVIRFSDPVLSSIIAKAPLEGSFQLVFGLLTALCIAFLGMMGSVKLSGALCLLTPIGNIAMMMVSAQNYAGGFAGMMSAAPIAWYLLGASILSAIAGIGLLADKRIGAFGRRRKEIQREYASLLRAWGTEYTSGGK